jgi:SAM-dependent methyltransferase
MSVNGALRTSPSEASRAAIARSVDEVLGTTQRAPHWQTYFKDHSERLALDYEWITHTVDKSAHILEIGGYPYFLTRSLQRAGYAIHSADQPVGESGHLAQQLSIPVSWCDIENADLPFADASFDEVVFNEVFEHLRINPIFAVRNLRRVLRPGGRLWLSTPNLKSLRGIINFLLHSEAWSVVGEGVYAQYRSFEKGDGMGHVREYTSVEVGKFLSEVGFEVDKVVYRGRSRNELMNAAFKLVPSFRPYFTIISRKAA